MTEKSLVDQIKHYQRDIVKCPEDRKRMLRCIERLHVLPIKISHLQETGVGRSVNELRKCGGEVGAAAGALVCKWKGMVRDEEEDGSNVESECEEYKEISTEHVAIVSDKQSNCLSYSQSPQNGNKTYREPNRHISRTSYDSSIRDNELSVSLKHKALDKSNDKVSREKSSKSAESSVSGKNASQRHKSDHHSSTHKKHHLSLKHDSKHNGINQNEKLNYVSKTSASTSNTSRSENKTKEINVDKSNYKIKDSNSSQQENKKKYVGTHKSDDKSRNTDLNKSLSKCKDSSKSDRKHNDMKPSKSESRGNEMKATTSTSEDSFNKDSKSSRFDIKSKHVKSKHNDNRIKDTSLSRPHGNKQEEISRRSDVKIKDKRDDKKSQDKSRASKDNSDKELTDKVDHKQNSSKKYHISQSSSESSDDDNEVYKPRRKRKRSISDEEKSFKNKSPERLYKPHKKRNYSSEESNLESGSDSSNDSNKYNTNHCNSDNFSDNDHGIKSEAEDDHSLKSYESDIPTNKSFVGSTAYEDSNNSRMDSSNSDESNSFSNLEVVQREIKREKESPPRYSISENTKSTQHKNTHQSGSHVKGEKTFSTTKNKFKCEDVKIKREKSDKINQSDLLSKTDKSIYENKYKPSSKSHRDISSKETKNSDKKVKVKIERAEDGSIDCESGASFADALLGLGDSTKKSSKKKLGTSPQEQSPKQVNRAVKDKSSSKVNASRSSSSSTSATRPSYNKEIDLLSRNVKLEPLDVDLSVTLPEITPNYKPQPHYSPPDSPAKRPRLTDDDALASNMFMSNKNQRTKVYSGNKSSYHEVPSLFDLCIQVLRENIDGLEYTGGVPYNILKPVLDRATASQLYNLEDYNPYLMEDTDGLWQFHCSRDFRGKKPDEFETWRELYWRCFDAREKKLQELNANITQSMAKSIPNQRKTKLAYVDSVVKPPRNVVRNQMKFGTAKAAKHELVSKAMVGAASASPVSEAAVRVPPPGRPHLSTQSFPIPNFLKKKKAPLMAKTLQLMKGHRFKR